MNGIKYQAGDRLMNGIKYRAADEMKDSGIEWLDNYPLEWHKVKLKYLFLSVQNGIWGDDEKGDLNDIPCIRVTNFNRDNSTIKMENLTFRNISQRQQSKFILHRGDLLIEKSGGGENQPVGFVVLFDSDIKTVYANFMAKIVLNTSINCKFINYYFRILYEKRVNARFINQTTGIQNIDSTEYFNAKDRKSVV